MKKRKLKKILKRADRALGEAFVVVSVLATDNNRIDDKDVTRVLSNLAFYADRKHYRVLPFETKFLETTCAA